MAEKTHHISNEMLAELFDEKITSLSENVDLKVNNLTDAVKSFVSSTDKRFAAIERTIDSKAPPTITRFILTAVTVLAAFGSLQAYISDKSIESSLGPVTSKQSEDEGKIAYISADVSRLLDAHDRDQTRLDTVTNEQSGILMSLSEEQTQFRDERQETNLQIAGIYRSIGGLWETTYHTDMPGPVYMPESDRPKDLMHQ